MTLSGVLMSEKFATASQTGEYFKFHAVNQTKLRRLRDIAVSALAVGTYLGNSDEATDRLYEQALVFAVENGINFFDTAVNYRCQRSEKNIGYAVRKLSSLGIQRNQIVVATKGGFLPAEGSAAGFREYIYKCFLNTGIISPEDIVANCHCMTPPYMQSQINLSLANLKLDSIDLYYLHNPEIQLPVVGVEEFYQRLTRVFEVFEQNVADGKIQRYGLATWNGFRQGFGANDLLDLERVLNCAKKVGGDNHHFAAIQLPYNMAMLEAVALPNQKINAEDFPIIPAAVHHGVPVMISASLLQSNILKLPTEIFDSMPAEDSPTHKALQFVTSSPGVTSAMVGMKTLAHVRENLEVLQMKNWTVEHLKQVAEMLVR